MRYLLDTHVFFWAVFQNEKLSARTKAIVEDAANEIIVSQISLLEIAIKHKVGKLTELKVGLPDVINEISLAGFNLLPIKNEHLIAYFTFAHFTEDHKDPFDRLLLATADLEKVSFITKDEKFTSYKNILHIVW